MESPQFRNPNEAFDDAIRSGALSTSPEAKNYAGKYMYMNSGYDGKVDSFKHIDNREYLRVQRA